MKISLSTQGTGNLIFAGDIGTSTPLADIIISQSANVSTKNIIAGSLTQLVGSGTTFINGTVQTNDSTGINLSGAAFTFGNNITTQANGPVVVNNSGTLTFTANTLMQSEARLSNRGSEESL